MILGLLLLLLLNILSTVAPAASFQFPRIKFVGVSLDKAADNQPLRRIENGQSDDLRISLEKHFFGEAQDASVGRATCLCWEPDVKESYEVASVLFREIALMARERRHCSLDNKNASPSSLSRVISCPSMSRPDDLKSIVEVLQSRKCKMLLGIEHASAELYPDAPAPYLHLSFSFSEKYEQQQEDLDYQIEVQSLPASESIAISNTEHWVNNFLGKYNLCPYTSSVSKAAVGLSSVKVPVGKVHIVAGRTNKLDDSSKINSEEFNQLRAAELASSFWSETVRLIQSPESEWATSLVVLPEYDNDFESFCDICDNIVQPIIEATASTDYIGRAWFHPKYDAEKVGHSAVIAGHAVPHRMVQQFIQSINGPESMKDISANDLGYANNKVRMTPHATINILRRSQLNAAACYENSLGIKRPKPNSIYVRNTLKLIEVLKGSKDSSTS